MYLVSTVYKKTRLGGKRHCQIFWFNIGTYEKNAVYDMTEVIAENFHFKIKGGSIIINCGSGTGFMVIEKALLENNPNEVIKNVSVFNQ